MELDKFEKLAAALDAAGWEIDSFVVERFQRGGLTSGIRSGFASLRVREKPEPYQETGTGVAWGADEDNNSVYCPGVIHCVWGDAVYG
jgi:hypothetical protein